MWCLLSLKVLFQPTDKWLLLWFFFFFNNFLHARNPRIRIPFNFLIKKNLNSEFSVLPVLLMLLKQSWLSKGYFTLCITSEAYITLFAEIPLNRPPPPCVWCVLEGDSRPRLRDLGIVALSETWVISPLGVCTSLSADWNQSTSPGRPVKQTIGHSLPSSWRPNSQGQAGIWGQGRSGNIS